MEIKPPDVRKCCVCGNTYSLNLFRQDQDVCRYCETGSKQPMPSQVKTEINQIVSSDITETQPRSESFLNKKIAMSNNSEEQDNYAPEYELKDLEAIALDLYDQYMYEINIIVGCLIRWSNLERKLGEVIYWISSLEGADSNFRKLQEQDKDMIRKFLFKFVNSTRINPTSIKASIRSLLRGKTERREKLINFIEFLLKDEANQLEAKKIVTEDLMIEGRELGYPIPIINSLNEDIIKSMLESKYGLQIITTELTTMNLAKEINENNYSIKLADIEDKVLESLHQLTKGMIGLKQIEGKNIDFRKGIKSSMHLYGIRLLDNEIEKGNNPDLVVDLS